MVVPIVLVLVTWESFSTALIGGFSFKCTLDYFKAEKVKYWPNMPELPTGNIC